MEFNKSKIGGIELDQTPNDVSNEASNRKRKELEDLALQTLSRVIDDSSFELNSESETTKGMILEKVNEAMNSILGEFKRSLSFGDKQKAAGYVMDEIFGYGPITKLLGDPTVTEVMVNGPNDVYIERSGKIQKTGIFFRDDEHVYHTIDKIITPLARRVDESSPMVDARLPDGSRVNIIIPPLAIKGPCITIRKFAVEPYTLENLITFGTLSHDMAKFLRACVKGRINIIISGGTGSGKTTLLNVVSGFIPDNERIVTVEDAAELQLQQEHVVALECRPANIEGKGRISIRDLVINTLRMRPDRIVVGEVRGGEALDMLQAMNTGHDGSLTTVHANKPRDALSRIETMVMMSGMDLPSRVIREQISSAINLIIQVERMADGSRKIIKVSEITGMEGETITLQDIFVFRQDGFNDSGQILGKHVSTGIVPKFMDKIKSRGEMLSSSIFAKGEAFTEEQRRC